MPVSVAGSPTVQVCIDPGAGDAVAAWFLDHDWIDEPVQRAFLEAVTPGASVLDLGSHLGVFSLSASALGARVLAVDANPEHTRLLALAAEENHFGDLHVANVALADSPDTVRFVPRSIHGHVLALGEADDQAIDVTATTVDRLLDDLGWDHLDVIKMDIEGSEMAALRGMARLFERGCRPTMVIESNASMLAGQGSSVPALRSVLAEMGYEVLLIDHLRPGVLVETPVDSVQVESASDVLAVTSRPEGLSLRWRIEPPLTKVQVITRVLDAAASPAAGYRLHSADLLRDGPPWLHEAGAVGPALEALARDGSAEVRLGRSPGGRSAGHDYHDAAEPSSTEVVDPVVVWADHLSIRRPRSELERPLQLATPDHEVVLHDISFHVDRGDPVGIVGADPGAGNLVLAALAGEDVLVSGALTVRGHAVALRSVGAGLEPSLSVGDNVALLGAFLGGHVPAVEARREDILGVVGLGHRADAPLQEVGAEAVTRLALAVAFECVRADLLLIGDLPVIGDADFRAWVRARAAGLRAASTAVIQVAHDPAGLLIDPTRLLWIEGGRLRSNGHAASVAEAVRLDRLGFAVAGSGWRSHEGPR